MPRARGTKSLANYKKIDKDFFNKPRNIPVIEKFISYLDKENFNDQDLQNAEKINSLLKFVFSLDKEPEKIFVQRVKTFFSKTSLNDFRRHFYKYSAYVATFLWVDRIQEIVSDPEEKRQILTSRSLTSSYKLYCILRGLKYERKTTRDLMQDQNLLSFTYIFNTSPKISQQMKNFINNYYREDFTEEEKYDITYHTRRFLMYKIENKKNRRSQPLLNTRKSPLTRGQWQRCSTSDKLNFDVENIDQHLSEPIENQTSPPEPEKNLLAVAHDQIQYENAADEAEVLTEKQSCSVETTSCRVNSNNAPTPSENHTSLPVILDVTSLSKDTIVLAGTENLLSKKRRLTDFDPVLINKRRRFEAFDTCTDNLYYASTEQENCNSLKDNNTVDQDKRPLPDDPNGIASKKKIPRRSLSFGSNEKKAVVAKMSAIPSVNLEQEESESPVIINLSSFENEESEVIHLNEHPVRVKVEVTENLVECDGILEDRLEYSIDLKDDELEILYDRKNDRSPEILNESSGDEGNQESTNGDSISRNILDRFEKQWRDQEFCDVELTASCGRKISGHKFVLSAGSTVFSTILKNDMNDKKDVSINLKNFNYGALKEMLRFMYSGKVEGLNHKTVSDLLAAADQFQIEQLKIHCKEFLMKSLNLETALSILRLSKIYGLEDLRTQAEEFILGQIKN